MTRRRPGGAVALAALSCILLSGCAQLSQLLPPIAPAQPAPSGLAPVSPQQPPLFTDDDDRSSLLHAVDHSLDQLRRLPPDRAYVVPGRRLTVADLQRTLEVFRDAVTDAPLPIDWNTLVRDRFEVLRAAPGTPMLFTGYYEPELRASRERTETFRYPIYRLPDDLVDIDLGRFCKACKGTVAEGRVKGRDFVPYYSRQEIDDYGVLAGRDDELAWLDDPIDVFFLHVQGSGLLRFDDGSSMRISFAGSNGHPYHSIGKILVERGKIPLAEVSMQTLRNYLRAHPDERDSLFNANERYIFFRPVPVGPIGSFNEPLTAGRSIAIDPKAYPLGSLMFIRGQRPGETGATLPLARFVCAQDTGAAITGPGRVDVFWGTGPVAARIAGPMHSPGELYLLVAK